MKRFLIPLLILALGWNIGLAASALYAVHLPIVRGAPLTVSDTTTVLLCSCGYATAIVTPDGEILVMVQDYARGGKLFVYADHNGPQLDPVAAPALVGVQSSGPAPSFAFPAQKNGPGGMVIKDGLLIIYAPGRPPGVTEGPYNLMRYRQPWPAHADAETSNATPGPRSAP